MTVGMPLVDLKIEELFSQLLFVVAAELDAKEVDRFGLETPEIVLPPARIEKHRTKDGIVGVQTFLVSRPLEYGHLLIDLRGYRCSKGKQGLHDLVVGFLAGTSTAEHGCRQRGNALFAGRIIHRSGLEQNAKRHQRRLV